VSFHWPFLGGLLPSRARLRFTGSLPIRHHEKLAQSPITAAPLAISPLDDERVDVSRFRFPSIL
jgi:hypothetical protein